MSDKEKDITSGALADAYRQCIAHMKTSFPIWEDFLMRGMKLHRSVEHTIGTLGVFIEGLGKVADIAARGKAGGTSDIGAGLSLLVTWHRAQEFKLKEMNTAFTMKLLAPLHSKIEEWKKATSQMDREHEKEVSRTVKEIKESKKSTLKMHKNIESKLKKEKMEKASILQHQLDQHKKDTNRLLVEAEDRERDNLNKVLLEERRWYSGFVAGFSKPLDVEVSMYSDVERLKVILSDLGETISQPNTLPVAAKEFVEGWSLPVSTTPPTHRRHPSLHNSSASLSSSHSHSSLGSEESVNITAPVQPQSLMPSGAVVPPTAISHPQAVEPPMAPPPAPCVPSSDPVQYAQTNFGAEYATTQIGLHHQPSPAPPPPPPAVAPVPPPPPCAPVPPPPPGAPIPPPPPGAPVPPPGPPGPPQNTQYNQYQQPQHQFPPAPPMAQFPGNYQQPPVQYNQPPGPPTSQYGAKYQQPHNSLPPPPPPNFPPAPEMCYDQAFPQPGSATTSVLYDDNFEPIGMSSMSVSPSQASLSSHYSSESGRSLSPPIGPTRTPGQSKAHLTSLQEEGGTAMASEPMDLHAALTNKLKQRSGSTIASSNGHTRNEIPPCHPRTSSLGSRHALSTSSTQKPPRAPSKPTRSTSFSHHNPLPVLKQAHHNHTPGVPVPLGAPQQPPHHNIMVSGMNRNSTCSSDSEPEEESAFAKALRLKKLKKTGSSVGF